MRLQVHDVLDS